MPSGDFVRPSTSYGSTYGAGVIQISGYGGYVSRIEPRNIHALTFIDAQKEAMLGPGKQLSSNYPSRDIYNTTRVGTLDASAKVTRRPRITEGIINFKPSGYGGFVPGIEAGNVFAKSYWPAQSQARNTLHSLAVMADDELARVGGGGMSVSETQHFARGLLSTGAPATALRPPTTTLVQKQTPPDFDEPRPDRSTCPLPDDVQITGFSGHIPKIHPQNIHSKVILDAQLVARGRLQLGKPTTAPARMTRSMIGLGGTASSPLGSASGSAAAAAGATGELEAPRKPWRWEPPSRDGLPKAEETWRPTRTRNPVALSSHISGYSGYVPHVFPRNVHGHTFQEIQKLAK
eukprot:tig00020610_g11973.t1